MIEHALAFVGAVTLFIAAIIGGWSLWIRIDGWRKGVRYGNIADGW